MGIKFDTFIFGVTQFAIGSEHSQKLLLERFFCFYWICLGGETRMAGDKTERSEGDIFWFGGCKRFLNHIGVSGLPVRMQDAGVDSEADTVAVLLTEPSGVDSLIEVGGIKFVLPDCFTTVDTPGNDCLVIRFYGTHFW